MNVLVMIANWKIKGVISQDAQLNFIVDKLGYKVVWDESCLNPEDQAEQYFSIRLRDGFGKRARVNYSVNIQEKTIFIADIDNQQMINRGIGSIILEYLDKRAAEFDIAKIYGNISPADMDHLPRLKYFYEKNGYTFDKTLIIKAISANAEIQYAAQ